VRHAIPRWPRFRRRAALAIAIVVAASAVRAEQVRGPTPGGLDEMRAVILSHLELRPGMTVADIGTGQGWLVFHAAAAVGAEGTVYATDIDPEAIEFVRRRLPADNPAAGARVELRLCASQRDTALDDLSDGVVDIVAAIDSLCFDTSFPLAENVAYLRRLARLLRPGGRLVHHMDCRCDVSTQSLSAMFRAAGFAADVERVKLGAAAGRGEDCRSAAERERHATLFIFHRTAPKPR
jgi:precorrin-6B methylase 2